MRIAFDLDNTLIPSGNSFEVERLASWKKFLGAEPLRLGVYRLFQELHREGCEVWIYTSSFRSSNHTRWTFYAHGLTLNGYINQARHNKTVSSKNFSGYPPSKYPPAFGIDLLIDDNYGHEREGQEYQFQTLILAPNDADWVNTVLNKIRDLKPRPPFRAISIA